MNKIKTATLQGKWTGDAESNNRWYVEQALALKGKGIDLVVLPEMFHTPYFPFEENADFFDMAIEKDSPLVKQWQGIAKEIGAVIVFPFFEKRARGIYHNSAFVFERDGSIAGLYRFLRKSGQMAKKLPNPKYVPKPYEQMQYPGQRVQIDVILGLV